MGIMGAQLKLKFITAYRNDLNAQATQLRNTSLISVMMASSIEQQSVPPSPYQFSYQRNQDGSYQQDQSGNLVRIDDNQAKAEYDQAMAQFEYQQRIRDAQKAALQQQDKQTELRLNQIDNQMKALDAEEESVKKQLDEGTKSFKTLG